MVSTTYQGIDCVGNANNLMCGFRIAHLDPACPSLISPPINAISLRMRPLGRSLASVIKRISTIPTRPKKWMNTYESPFDQHLTALTGTSSIFS